MTRRAAALLLLALAAAVGLLLLVNHPRASRARRPFPLLLRVTSAPLPAATPPAGAPAAPAETVRLTLLFPGREDSKLRPEERDIAKPSGGGASLKAIFAELQRGPRRKELLAPIPQTVQLRNAFLLNDGVAVIDLAVDSGLSFGSGEELTLVASLVDTVLQNVADTNRVRILVNGEPAETLGGHVDLTHPIAYLRSELAP